MSDAQPQSEAMTLEQKWREDFERWFGGTVKLTRDPDGYYEYMAAHSAWHAYLAACKARESEIAQKDARIAALLDALVSIEEYWNGGEGSAVDAAEEMRERARATIAGETK